MEFALILPLILVLLLAIVDFARLYTTMLTVESAAREAADYGAFHWYNWQDAPTRHRDGRGDGAAGLRRGQQPARVHRVRRHLLRAGRSSTTRSTRRPVPAVDCAQNPAPNANPCRVNVQLTYDFRLLSPLRIELLGTTIGIPASLTFSRDATFALSDLRDRQPVTRAVGSGSRGQAMVEFALVAPIFFLLLFAIIEGGRFIFYYELLNNATREGARYAIIHGAKGSPCSGPPVGTASCADAAGNNVIDATRNAAIGLVGSGDLDTLPAGLVGLRLGRRPIPARRAAATTAAGQCVTVFLAYSYQTIIPILPPITISAESSLVINN